MFSSRPSSSRRSSTSKSRDEGREAGHSSSRRRSGRVKSDDLKTTFENMIYTISNQQGTTLDKESVLRMIRSMYDWIVFDPNIQLDVPTAPGSGSAQKMWPHGAVVDSRRKQPSDHEEKSSRKLRDLDEDVASVVTGSVVSSTYDEQKSVKSRGEVMYDVPRGTIYNPMESYGPPMNVPSHYAPGPPPMMQPRTTRIVPEGFQPAHRYSVLRSNVAPVETVVETPEPKPAQISKGKKVRRPKIGTVSRDNDGVEQKFADE